MEKKRSRGEVRGSQKQTGLAPHFCTDTNCPFNLKGLAPTRTVQIEGVGDGVQAEGLSYSTRLQLLVQILLNEPQVLST